MTPTFADLQDYTYYFVPAPWLSVKLLRLLQCYPLPTDDVTSKSRLIESLEAVLNRSQVNECGYIYVFKRMDLPIICECKCLEFNVIIV